jgi:hypothetical protein
MSVVPRPTDSTTEQNLLIGMPFVEFAIKNANGTYDPYRNLGIVDAAELQKTVDPNQLRSSQSGISILVRELVRQFDAQLQVQLFNFEPENMRLAFGASTLTLISSGTPTKTGDPFTLTDDNQDFLDLSESLIDEPVASVSCEAIVLEEVGTQATGGEVANFGETLGDFALDWKPLAAATGNDVTAYIETTAAGVATDRTADLVGGNPPVPAPGEIGINDTLVVNAGQILYPAGETIADGTSITVSYEPSHAFVENTDFVVDYKEGRVRILQTFDGAGDALRSYQPMEATYDYTEIAHSEIDPYTQFEFQGKSRVRLLTDVGINMIWAIPKSSIRLTDDAFAFSRDNPGLATLLLNILDNGGSQPYGIMEIYEEQ